jgi:hypothetical protein
MVKYMKVIFPFCLGWKEGKLKIEITCMGVTQQMLWGKPGAILPWRNWEQTETDRPSNEKLISNSQTCSMSRRG